MMEPQTQTQNRLALSDPYPPSKGAFESVLKIPSGAHSSTINRHRKSEAKPVFFHRDILPSQKKYMENRLFSAIKEIKIQRKISKCGESITRKNV